MRCFYCFSFFFKGKKFYNLIFIEICFVLTGLFSRQIGPTGARGLAFGLAEAGFAGERLDLRLNPLADEGGCALAALLRRNLGPRGLGLAGATLGTAAGLHLAEALRANCGLQVRR